MGLFGDIRKRISSAFAPPRPDPIPDKLVQFLSGWQRSNTIQTSTYSRITQVQAYRGWDYVAIDARASESACQVPKVGRIVESDKVEDEYRKSLHATAKSLGRSLSHQECQWVRAAQRRKYLSKSMRKKALVHVQDSDEIEQVSSNHALVRLLQNPNGPDVAYTFGYRIFMYLRIHGVAYLWTVPNMLGTPVQMWGVPPAWVYEYPTDVHGRETEKLIGSYELRPVNMTNATGYEMGMGWLGGASGKRRVDESEIIKIAYVNPMSLTDSWSPLQATAAWTDTANAIDATRVQTLYHGAYPGIVLQLDKEVLNPDMAGLERIKEKFEEKAAGVRNFRKAYVLAPGLTIAPSPWQSSVELDHVNSANQIRDWKLASHRVGPTMAGITEQTSYAADDAARQSFYQGPCKADLTLVGQVLTEKLAKRFGDDLCIYYEDPRPSDPEFLLKEDETLHRMSATTTNEIRQGRGREPFEFGGDNPVSAGMAQELPWVTGELSMMPGMDGGGFPPEGGEQGGDALDDVMGELLGGAGGDGASETPGLPTPLKNRVEGNGALNGNGKH